MSKEIMIYFGRNIKDEKGTRRIEENDFWGFLNQFVMPSFGSFTILPGVGVWKSYVEPCSILVINTDTFYTGDAENIKKICNKYCEIFSQECVLVTMKDVETTFYGRE